MKFLDTLFSSEFKVKVVLEVLQNKMPLDQVAKQRNVPVETLAEWVALCVPLNEQIIAQPDDIETQEKMARLLGSQNFNNSKGFFGKIVLEHTTNLISLCDVNTYETLYINKACQEAYQIDLEDLHKKKCYELFYGYDKPCEFCMSSELYETGRHKLKLFDPTYNRYLEITNHLVCLDGRSLRLEIGVDIDEKESLIAALDQKITMDEVQLSCIRTLTFTEDMQQAIEKIMELMCNYHQGSRGYIFEISPDGTMLNNTYEWCAPGATAEIENLQNIPIEVAADWFANFEEKGSFYISNLNQDLSPTSSDYRILEAQNIQSLMAAPLIENGIVRGFMGVDDPHYEANDFALLSSVTYFIINDIQKRRLVDELAHLSYVDSLTQLFNRNKYIKDLDLMEERHPTSLGVVYMDLNGLKVANDQFGHSYGDFILRQMNSVLTSIFELKHCYRIGGDEFIALRPNCTRKEFEQDVARLRTAMATSKEFTASIGATWEEGVFHVRELIKHADDLMYANKQKHYQSMEVSDYNHNSSLAMQLIEDIKQGKYTVYLQPKIFLQDGALYGAEALVRGIGRDGNLVFPDSFIPLYEANGIIRHIDFFVLETVCQLMQTLALQGKEIGSVSVNFSRITLLEYDVVSQISAICQKHQIDPSRLTIEVTESTAKLQMNELVELVQKIKEAGFDISLDDYGAKYSNLAVLSNIGFDEIKLDRSIISNLSSSEKNRTITQYTIQMLKELKMCRVVAEGIETSTELDWVKQFGCDYGQGYHFSRPIPIDEFLEKYLSGSYFPQEEMAVSSKAASC